MGGNYSSRGLEQWAFQAHLLVGIPGPHPVVHDDTLVCGTVPVMLFVPSGADLVKGLLLIREHHLVDRLHGSICSGGYVVST